MPLKNNAAGGHQTAIKCNFCKRMIVLTDIQDFVLRQIRADWSRGDYCHEFIKRHKGKPYSQRDLYFTILELDNLKQISIFPPPDEFCRIPNYANLDIN